MIKYTKEEILKALQNAKTVNDASAKLGMHRNTLTAYCKKHMGTTPFKLITKGDTSRDSWNRIELPGEAMKTTLSKTQNVQKAAKAFNVEVSTFRRRFVEAFALTPVQYLQSQRHKVDELIVKAKNDELIKEIQRRGYFVEKDPQDQDYTFEPDLKLFDGETYKIGIVSDTHLCSKYQQLTHLKTFYEYCAQQGITEIFNGGDITDGQKMHRDHEYELFLHGADDQIDYVVRHYPEVSGIKTHFIVGNHDASHYNCSGTDIGKAIARDRKDMKYLGFYGAFLSIGGVENLIYLHHGAGGVSYARSYKSQKIVEQFQVNKKPHIHILGHYHVSNILPRYRNVYSILMPCFQGQTPYLRRKALNPEVGGVILEFTVNRDNKPTIPKVEFVPFYDLIDKDY